MSHSSTQRQRRIADSRAGRHHCRPLVEELEPRTLLSTTVIYNPIQMAVAYGFPGAAPGVSGAPGVGVSPTAGAGETIAIVDAYNDPTITSDVSTFDSQVNTAYGAWPSGAAPVPALASGQLTIVNQTGGTIKNQTSTRNTTPAYNSSWDVEIALDVEWSHAMAPGANILLVEASSDSISDLMTAVSYAAGHAQVVSMSWGSNEFSGETADDATFAAFAGTGVTFVASSGDSGVVSWPAVSPDVVGVGGTVLNLTSLNGSGVYSNETAWSDSGGGISKYETLPSYQAALGTVNGASTVKRNSPDIAYDSGASNNYVWVYDAGDWYGVYGTSAGAPQWSALIASADQGLTSAGAGPLDATQTLPGLYSLPGSAFHDITSGQNSGHKAGAGYDLVTGLGSPIAGSVIAGLITYGENNVSSTTPFAAVAAGRAGSPGSPSDSEVDILATVGVQTAIHTGPASVQTSLPVSSAVQKLTTPPLEVVPAAAAASSMGGALAGTVATGGIGSAAPGVLSSGSSSVAAVVAGRPDSLTGSVLDATDQAWSLWSSALLPSAAPWDSSTDFDAAGWPMLAPLSAEDVTDARREEEANSASAVFGMIAE